MRLFSRRPLARPRWDDRPTEDDVFYAYRLFLKRDPDPAGFEHYRQLIAGGLTLDRLIRAFENSDERRGRADDEWRPTPVDLGGYQVCVQKRDTDFGQAIYHSHDYEPHVRGLIRKHVREGDVVVDVGANVGCIAFQAAVLVKDSGLVVAVEPNPDNLRLLFAGLVLNGFGNVRVLAGAASDRAEVISLTGGVSNTHVVAARPPDGGQAVYAQAFALDDWLGWLPRLDLLKMDLEGYEPQALDGMQALVSRHRPTLLIEFNPRCLGDLHGHDPRAFLDRLFDLYPGFRALDAFGDDVPFERAADLMDFWYRRNRELTAEGRLPDRLLHFDLVSLGGRA
jgi:FkbM family methyltransferase